MSKCEIIDATRDLGPETPVWPSDTPFEAITVARIEENGYYLRRVCFSEHASTHIDAPAHFIPKGMTLDMLPPILGGRLDIVRLDDLASGEWVGRRELETRLPTGENTSVVLLYNGSNWRGGDPCRHIQPLTSGAAEALVERGYRLVLTDAPGPDCDPFPAHRILLSNNVPIVENVLVSGSVLERLLSAETSYAVVVPMKMSGASGGPVRVFFLLGADCGLPFDPKTTQ